MTRREWTDFMDWTSFGFGVLAGLLMGGVAPLTLYFLLALFR